MHCYIQITSRYANMNKYTNAYKNAFKHTRTHIFMHIDKD